MSRVIGWKEIKERFSKKMSNWKVKMMSVGRRSLLLKLILGSLGTFYMSFFLMPVQVAKDLEALRSQLCWGGTNIDRKLHWIAWDQILADKKYGGLDIGSLVSLNFSLLQNSNEDFTLNKVLFGFKLLSNYMVIVEVLVSIEVIGRVEDRGLEL